MKKYVSIITTFIAFVTVFCSCKKNSEEFSNKKSLGKQLSSLSREGSCTPENTFNSFDSIGYIHNACMDVTLANLHYNSSVSNIIGVFHQANIPYGIDYVLDSNMVLGILNHNYNNTSDDYMSIFETTVNESAISDLAKSYIINTTRAIADSNYEFNFCNLKQMILQAEDQVISDNSLNSGEKKFILSFFSIQRYSFYKVIDLFHLTGINDNVPTPMGLNIRAVEIGLSDCYGWLEGCRCGGTDAAAMEQAELCSWSAAHGYHPMRYHYCQ